MRAFSHLASPRSYGRTINSVAFLFLAALTTSTFQQELQNRSCWSCGPRLGEVRPSGGGHRSAYSRLAGGSRVYKLRRRRQSTPTPVAARDEGEAPSGAEGAFNEGNGTEQNAEISGSFLPSDWRDFRARLVQKEQEEATTGGEQRSPRRFEATTGTAKQSPSGRRGRRIVGSLRRRTSEDKSGRRKVAVAGLAGLAIGRLTAPSEEEGQAEWAYETPLIEQGSVILTRPGGYFAMHQQYFHKAVILIINHRGNFDLGIIINRPTSLTTSQLGVPGPDWNVWYGGDCEGFITSRTGDVAIFCLHTLEIFAPVSKLIIPGVYLMDFETAQDVVSRGLAETDDFKLFLGYCGWGDGQLQSELDRGDVWKMVAVDRRIMMRELREAKPETFLPSRMVQLDFHTGPDDGIGIWQRWYSALDPAMSDAGDVLDDGVGDAMLRRWVDMHLQP